MKQIALRAALAAVALLGLLAAACKVEAHGYGCPSQVGVGLGYSGYSGYSNVGLFAVPFTPVQAIAVAVPTYPQTVLAPAPVQFQAATITPPPAAVVAAPAPVVELAAPVVVQPPVLLEAVAPVSYGCPAGFNLSGDFYGGEGHLFRRHHPR